MKSNKATVFVGMSGGVDSSVAALRLKKAGYEVVGVFIKVWHPDFLKCNWEEERVDAMKVAAQLDIPFLTCDAEKTYKQEVADYFIEEYQAGRTPNPDVMCNQAVKFGAFFEFAKAKGADYIATGHYVQNNQVETGYALKRGIDENKDQSYFLWTLNQDILKCSLFPVGDTPKDKIRKEAEAAGLKTASKKDSQGICFLGHIDIPEFLSHYVDLSPGKLLDESQNVIGEHQGALVYTVGQRHGFNINPEYTDQAPFYVIDKSISDNTVTVSNNPPELVRESGDIILEKVNWIADKKPKNTENLVAQFRYRQEPVPVELHLNENEVKVVAKADMAKPAIGQSCVIYDGNECLGGGIIKRI